MAVGRHDSHLSGWFILPCLLRFTVLSTIWKMHLSANSLYEPIGRIIIISKEPYSWAPAPTLSVKSGGHPFQTLPFFFSFSWFLSVTQYGKLFFLLMEPKYEYSLTAIPYFCSKKIGATFSPFPPPPSGLFPTRDGIFPPQDISTRFYLF